MMAISRDVFLQRVRDAVQAGNRPGAAPSLPERGTIGYQGAGPDSVARFCTELTAAGGQPYLVRDDAEATAKVLELVQAKMARHVLLGQGSVLERLGFAERLRSLNLEVISIEQNRDALFAADLGISGVDFLVAETGSLVVRSRPDEPRSLSLLPPVHIAVADRSQLVPDLFDLFNALPTETEEGKPVLPPGISLITGPSKTGDIELRLVTGVHGPGEVHLVLITG
jgi:L-lactate utilization protein LutC